MTFLPIVERELRVAARRRSTYWLRVLAAFVALIVGSGMLLLTLVPFIGQMQSGGGMFSTLTWMSLAAALCAGLFFTSDCLSEEKREGTLGFLFLTDLRGYDVVLGKLLAGSLRGVLPLLAIFPVLATTQLMGGVDVGQFWRTVLAVGNAAFFSLATGLLVSAISRQALKALAGTVLLLVFFLGFGPFIDRLQAFTNGRFVPFASLASPGYTFVAANHAGTFWPALTVSQAVAWTLLALACFLVRRTWQEKPIQYSATASLRGIARRYGGSKRGQLLRATLLERNPVAWLVARERGQSLVLWTGALAMLACLVVLLLADLSEAWWQVWSMINRSLWFGLYLWVAARACQFFADARRTGMIELLAASPMTSRDTVQGAWQGLLSSFASPVLVLLGLQLVATTLGSSGSLVRFNSGDDSDWLGVVAIIVGVAVVPINLIALAWFGLWMGLTSKSTFTATLKTLAFVQVIPWFAIYLVTWLAVSVLLIPATLFSGGKPPSTTVVRFWLQLLFVAVPSVLGVVKDVILWTLARRKLCRNFRELAVRSIIPIQVAVAPPFIKPNP